MRNRPERSPWISFRAARYRKRERECHLSESRRLAEGLSRRAALSVIAVAAAAPPAAAAQTPNAELIDLGARFEPLLDRYYVAHRRSSHSLAAAHAEHDREFGSSAERNHQYPPKIVAAFSDSCKRSGAHEADDALSAIHQKMKPLANAINASSVTSIEGFRAMALVAFWEVAPLGAGDTEFTFEDAYPFRQLFTAVAELCGLKNKMAATGYALPDIAMGDDETDDEGQEA